MLSCFSKYKVCILENYFYPTTPLLCWFLHRSHPLQRQSSRYCEGRFQKRSKCPVFWIHTNVSEKHATVTGPQRGVCGEGRDQRAQQRGWKEKQDDDHSNIYPRAASSAALREVLVICVRPRHPWPWWGSLIFRKLVWSEDVRMCWLRKYRREFSHSCKTWWMPRKLGELGKLNQAGASLDLTRLFEERSGIPVGSGKWLCKLRSPTSELGSESAHLTLALWVSYSIYCLFSIEHDIFRDFPQELRKVRCWLKRGSLWLWPYVRFISWKVINQGE